MKHTEWKVKGIFKADAEKVDAEIKSIGEEVSPDDLVEYARNREDSELHKCFEWDDSIAAQKYRLSQARTVLRCLVTVTEKEDAPAVREFSLSKTKSIYKPTRTFLVNRDEYELLLQRAIRDLKALENKYKTLTELDSVFAAIDEL